MGSQQYEDAKIIIFTCTDKKKDYLNNQDTYVHINTLIELQNVLIFSLIFTSTISHMYFYFGETHF